MAINSINRTGDYGRTMFYRNMLSRQHALRDELSAKLSSGVQHRQIGKYAAELTPLLSLQSELSTLERNSASLTVVQTHLHATQDALRGRDLPGNKISGEGIAGVMDLLEGMLTSARGAISSQDSTNFRQWQESFSEPFANALRRITQLMNTKIGDRYLFAGENYTTAPVVDFSRQGQLVAYTEAEVHSLLDLPSVETFSQTQGVGSYLLVNRQDQDLAFYHQDFTQWQAAAPDAQQLIAQRAYRRHAVNVQQFGTIAYGVDAMEEAFQTVAEAMRALTTLSQIETGGGETFDLLGTRQVQVGGQTQDISLRDDVRRLFDRSQRLLVRAHESLDNLADRVGLLEAQVAKRADVIATRQEHVNLAITQITQVDTVGITVQLSALNQQIQASYQSILTGGRLSLVNFI